MAAPISPISAAPTVKRKKSVRFADASANNFHPGLGLTKPELKALHYSAKDLAKMKDDIFVALHLKQNNVKLANFEWRGLEHLANGTYETIIDRKMDFIREFMLLQCELNDSKEFHLVPPEDQLSEFVVTKSKADIKDALKKAKQDAVEAKKVYKADKITSWETNGALSGGKSLKRKPSFIKALVKGIRPKRTTSLARVA